MTYISIRMWVYKNEVKKNAINWSTTPNLSNFFNYILDSRKNY